MNGALPKCSIVGAGGVALHDAADSAQIVRVVSHVVTAVKVRGEHERKAHDPLDHHPGSRAAATNTNTAKSKLIKLVSLRHCILSSSVFCDTFFHKSLTKQGLL